MRRVCFSSLLVSSLGLLPAVTALAQPVRPVPRGVKLTDEELARVTGKFILSNGVELALTITSNTIVDGRLLLRTVLTVDKVAELQVLARRQGDPAIAYSSAASAVPAAGGVTVSLDRQLGIQTVTPTISVGNGPSVSVGTVAPGVETLELTALPLTPGGPAITTTDGVVSLETVRNGSRVTFASNQLGIVNLVGQSVATAVLNSADNRTIDTVTNITIDARNIAPYQAGTAQMRVESLAIDATRGMVR